MEKVIELKVLEPTALLGVGDAHLKLLESIIPATIVIRGEIIKIQGNEHDHQTFSLAHKQDRFISRPAKESSSR